MRGLDAILIAGPTASGKSALAAQLAAEIGGVVINADSMQVYRDLRIVTARPTAAEEQAVPHRLFGHLDGAVTFSVGRYVEHAAAAIAGARTAGLVPIVAGGTGLYFKALTDGLSDLPPVPEEVRARVRASAEGRATADLHAVLAGRDPAGADRLRPTDRQRLLRALEVVEATGRPLSALQGLRQPGPLTGRAWRGVFLAPPRDVLRDRIDRRFVRMTREGAIEEVEALARRGLDPAFPVMRAHGVPALLAFLRGEIGLDEAVRRGQADTRAYAKRQFTWFRHQMPGWESVAPEQALDTIRRPAAPAATFLAGVAPRH